MSDISKILSGLRAELGTAPREQRLHPKQQEIFNDRTNRIIGVVAGNRSGKTHIPVSIVRGLAEGTYSPMGRPPEKEYTVCFFSLDHILNRDVILPKFRQIIPNGWLADNIKGNRVQTPTYTIVIGPVAKVHVLFKSADSGREKLQGFECDMIFADEEPPEDCFKELMARLISKKGIMLATFTPLNGITWSMEYFSKHKIYRMSMRDNTFLDPAEIDLYASDLTEEERRMRIEGEYVDMAGSRFLSGKDNAWIDSTKKSATLRMRYTDDSFMEDDNGELYIYSDEIRPKSIRACGIDVATGQGRDFSVIKIKEMHNGVVDELACFRSNITSVPALSRVAMAMCHWYDDPYVNIEKNGVGVTLLQEMLERGYKRFAGAYNREDLLTEAKLCFTSSEGGRNWLLSESRRAIQNRRNVVRDYKTAHELMQMQYMKNRYDHPKNGHDDCVFADALAWITFLGLPEEEKPVTVPEGSHEWFKKYVELNKCQKLDFDGEGEEHI
jgi:phage terminase large subunit-like protein